MNHHHLFPSLLTGMLLAGMCLFVSCTDAESTDTPAAVPGTLVEVPLRVSAEAFADGTPSLTRGSYVDSASDEDNTIKNIWVLQFAGTTDDAALLGAQYIEDYTSGTIVKLIASTAENRILVIANTFNPTVAFLSCATMADVKALARTIPDEREVSATSTPGSLTCVHYDGSKYYVTMNGSVDKAINETATISLTLKRNVAKVNVIVTNATTGDAAVTLQSVTLMNVPDKFFYYTNYGDKPDLFPVAGTYKTITYTPTSWDEGSDAGSNTRKFTFYLPENLRGTTHDTEATPATQVTKEMYSPADATKAYLLGTYDEGGAVCEVSYTYVLGANLVDDCNLRANYEYTYNVTLDHLGSPEVDYRVGTGSLIDFRKQALANSYIINPSTALGAWTTVRIPLQRIYDFWGNQGYEDEPNNALLENCYGWHADVIWSDVQLTNDLFQWTINSGATYKDYVEFKVRQGLEGNIVFGVRRYNDGTKENLDDVFLWSWHLWVTDYKPQQAITNHYQPVEGQYVYPVTGGDVHRYNNTIFNTGIYKEKFIMDRNLGARSTDYVGSYGAGCLYYQYGRKDPFPGNVSYKGSDAMPSYATVANSGTGANPANANVPYSVNHPRTYITGSYWTTNDKYNPSTYQSAIRWQDPKVTTDAGKSIFDPCPPGWRVPKNGTWEGFNTTTPTTTFVWNSPKATGRNYKLNGTDVTAGTAFYPASGYRNSSNGSLSYGGSGGYYWSSSPGSQTNGYSLNFNSGGVNPSSDCNRANGFPVRCIAE